MCVSTLMKTLRWSQWLFDVPGVLRVSLTCAGSAESKFRRPPIGRQMLTFGTKMALAMGASMMIRFEMTQERYIIFS